MAYADIIRSAFPTMEDIADLIEGIASADMPTTFTPYTPNPAASGSMTWTSTTNDACEYVRLGKLCWVRHKLTGTVGGTLSDSLLVDLPFASITTGSGAALYLPVTVQSGGGNWEAGVGIIGTGATQIIYRRTLYTNYGAGAGGVGANFFYKVA